MRLALRFLLLLIAIVEMPLRKILNQPDEKINLMEIALSEAKLNNQIANNTSALKSNEAENSKTTQTEPISANDENSEEFNPRAITWEEFDRIVVNKILRKCSLLMENVKDGLNIYIRKNNGTVSVPLKKAL